MNQFGPLAIVMTCVAASLTGCGGSDSGMGPPPTITAQILSDAAFDGDIQQTSPSTYIITQGMSPSVQSVFAGIDPGTLSEFRTFLDFPLSGTKGVPANANIDSAFLDVYINSFMPGTATLPVLIELVAFQPPTLIATDFNRSLQPPLASVRVSPSFTQTDVGTHVSIDVTSLMMKAQQLGLVDFQVRIMEDLGPAIVGLIEINDSTGSDRAAHAPELMVTYF
jgi:hypothetical protein